MKLFAPDKVVLDAGHNSKDPGAVYNGVTEYEEMRRFRTKLEAKFKADNHEVISDKDHETNRVFQNRIRTLLKTGDITAAFHLNSSASGTATGVEVFISKSAGKDSKAAANELSKGLSEIMGIHNRGVKVENQSQHSSIGILNLRGSAVLIEFGFIQTDLQKFRKHEDEIVDFVFKILKKYDRN